MIAEAKKKKIYIAGPMRCYVKYNWPAFDHAKAQLEADGWEVVSPADIDRAETSIDVNTLPVSHDWTKGLSDIPLKKCVVRDITAIADCDAMYLLRGWGDSVGAKAEHAVALWLGLELLFEQ